MRKEDRERRTRERNKKDAGMKGKSRGRGSEWSSRSGGIGVDLSFLMQVISFFALFALLFRDGHSFLSCLCFCFLVPLCRIKVVFWVLFLSAGGTDST